MILKEKERLILQKIADGECKKVIADDMGTSYQYVKNLLQNVRFKLDAASTENAVAIGIRTNLIQ